DQATGLDLWIGEHFVEAIDRSTGNSSVLERSSSLFSGATCAPGRHSLVYYLMIVSAIDIIAEPGIACQIFPTDEAGPSTKHRIAYGWHYNPSVADPIDVARGSVVARIALLAAHGASDCPLGQQGHHECDTCSKKGYINELAPPGALSFVKGQHSPKS